MKSGSDRWLLALVLLQAALAFDCGQNQAPTIVPFVDKNAITVSVSPSSGVVAAGQSLQLTASVTGTDQKDVAWTIFGSSPDAGSIDANGLENLSVLGDAFFVKAGFSKLPTPFITGAIVQCAAPARVFPG